MYRRTGLIAFLVCIVAVIVAGIPPESVRNAHGSLVQIHISNGPFTVQLRNGSGDIVCAGTLITYQHVLTAAQCFEKYEPAELTVVAGAETKSDTGVQRGIEKVIKHESYNAKTFHNDAAVLKLQSPLEASERVEAVDVCSQPLQTYDVVGMYGWPKSQQDAFYNIMNSVLMKKDCIEQWQEESIATTYPDSIVCDGNELRFPCTHVPGGTGLFNEEVCGILIGGPGCEDPNFPGALTSVYDIREFILSAVKATSD